MLPLAFTCGDPSGVGPEVIEKWLAAHAHEAAHVTVLGPAKWVAQLPLPEANRVALGPADWEATPGHPCDEGARIALAAMEEAAAGTREGRYAGVVTGPVSKARLAAVGYPFPGQTEFFADRWSGEPVMAFAGGRLRVVLHSWHIPLRQVPATLTQPDLLRSIRAADRLARALGCATPRIGMCGLNPHAGEGGLLGHEERDIIDPLLNVFRTEFPGLSRCEPSDTLFARHARGEFDVVVALYHDQGLAPLKLVDFDESVNITLGLPYVRTSPDHGTAFGIAGKGQASFTSFANAVEMARLLVEKH